MKSLALCNYYSLTRPERRAQCKRYGDAPGPREGAGIEGAERGGMMDGGEAGEGTGHGERIMFIHPPHCMETLGSAFSARSRRVPPF